MWGYDNAVLLPDGDILIETFANNPEYVELPDRAPYGQRVFVHAEEYRRRQTSVMHLDYEIALNRHARQAREKYERLKAELDAYNAFTGEYCDQ